MWWLFGLVSGCLAICGFLSYGGKCWEESGPAD